MMDDDPDQTGDPSESESLIDFVDLQGKVHLNLNDEVWDGARLVIPISREAFRLCLSVSLTQMPPPHCP